MSTIDIGGQEDLRKPGRISVNRLGAERNVFREKIEVREESNIDAVNSALQYCMAAIKELERIKLAPVLDIEKLDQLKRGIPNIEVYAERAAERSFPRENPDPFASFPSDWEQNHTFQKLMERAKKALRQ